MTAICDTLCECESRKPSLAPPLPPFPRLGFSSSSDLRTETITAERRKDHILRLGYFFGCFFAAFSARETGGGRQFVSLKIGGKNEEADVGRREEGGRRDDFPSFKAGKKDTETVTAIPKRLHSTRLPVSFFSRRLLPVGKRMIFFSLRRPPKARHLAHTCT